MATQADVRRIALSLPETEEAPNHFAFSVRTRNKPKGFAWVWMERVHPKKARVPQPKVVAIRVASLDDKEFLLRLNPAKFFTEPHYNGFPAVLVRLPAVSVRELRPLLTEAWRSQAPRDLAPIEKRPLGTEPSRQTSQSSGRTIRVRLVQDGSACVIPVPFDPKAVFGKVRAPVRVTVNGYTYRSTIAAMGGTICIPLRRSHREAAGLHGDETVEVQIALDQAKRAVTVPRDLAAALKAAPPAWERWRGLSFSHQREHVEAIADARKPETRARRIQGAVRMLRALHPKPPRGRDPLSFRDR